MPFFLIPVAIGVAKVATGVYAAHKVKEHLDGKKQEETERKKQEEIQRGVDLELAKREIAALRAKMGEQDDEQDA